MSYLDTCKHKMCFQITHKLLSLALSFTHMRATYILWHYTSQPAYVSYGRMYTLHAPLKTLEGSITTETWLTCHHRCVCASMNKSEILQNINHLLDWVGEEVLKEYKNPALNRGLQAGDRCVRQVNARSVGEAVMHPAGAEGSKGLDEDDDEDEPAETAVCAFVANNLHKGGNRRSWKALQQGWKKREKKEPPRLGNPPLSSGDFIPAHPQCCFFCYRQTPPFQHDHRACPIHKADTEVYKKAHVTKKRTSAKIWKANLEVSKDELSKLLMVRTELAKEMEDIKRA